MAKFLGRSTKLSEILDWCDPLYRSASCSNVPTLGKAFHITEITKGRYYYPKEPHGKGEISNTSRLLKEGEIAEWILLDGASISYIYRGGHFIELD